VVHRGEAVNHEMRLPRTLTGISGQSVALLVAGHLWLAAAVVLILFAREQSIGEAPLGVWMVGYGLPLLLMAWGLFQTWKLRHQYDRLSLMDRVVCFAGLVAALYPALVFVWIMYKAK
jgi:hypothetical protein